MGKKNKSEEDAEETVKVAPSEVQSEEDAVNLVLLKYQVPDNVKIVYVTEDCNVFFNEGTAGTHANQNKLKLFRIRWD